MVGGGGDDEPVLSQGVHGEGEVGRRRAQQRDVDRPGAQRLDLVGREHLAAEGEVDARKLLREPPRECGQETVRRRAHAPDREVSHRAGRDAPRVVSGLVDVGEDRACPLEVGPAGLGEVDAAGGAVEQLDAELGFQLADLLGERRLGHVEPLGGATEVTLLGHRHEVPKVAQIHMWSISIGSDMRTSEYRGPGLASLP